MELVEKHKIIEKEAVNMFCSSNTFAQLTDETTEIYKKDRTEIYELLIQEKSLK
jgi:NAD/NADP transhydrogenase alpha subunit